MRRLTAVLKDLGACGHRLKYHGMRLGEAWASAPIDHLRWTINRLSRGYRRFGRPPGRAYSIGWLAGYLAAVDSMRVTSTETGTRSLTENERAENLRGSTGVVDRVQRLLNVR